MLKFHQFYTNKKSKSNDKLKSIFFSINSKIVLNISPASLRRLFFRLAGNKKVGNREKSKSSLNPKSPLAPISRPSGQKDNFPALVSAPSGMFSFNHLFFPYVASAEREMPICPEAKNPIILYNTLSIIMKLLHEADFCWRKGRGKSGSIFVRQGLKVCNVWKTHYITTLQLKVYMP